MNYDDIIRLLDNPHSLSRDKLSYVCSEARRMLEEKFVRESVRADKFIHSPMDGLLRDVPSFGPRYGPLPKVNVMPDNLFDLQKETVANAVDCEAGAERDGEDRKSPGPSESVGGLGVGTGNRFCCGGDGAGHVHVCVRGVSGNVGDVVVSVTTSMR